MQWERGEYATDPSSALQCTLATSSSRRTISDLSTARRSCSLLPCMTCCWTSSERSRKCWTKSPSMKPAEGDLSLSALNARNLREHRQRARELEPLFDELFLLECSDTFDELAHVPLEVREHARRGGVEISDRADCAGRRAEDEARNDAGGRVASHLPERACPGTMHKYLSARSEWRREGRRGLVTYPCGSA